MAESLCRGWPRSGIGRIRKDADPKGIISRPVQNAHAFHSRMLDPIVTAFAEEVRNVPLSRTENSVCLQRDREVDHESRGDDSSYWARHANHTARFSDALHQLWQFKDAILLEAGPGKTLGVLASQHPGGRHANP